MLAAYCQEQSGKLSLQKFHHRRVLLLLLIYLFLTKRMLLHSYVRH